MRNLYHLLFMVFLILINQNSANANDETYRNLVVEQRATR